MELVVNIKARTELGLSYKRNYHFKRHQISIHLKRVDVVYQFDFLVSCKL